jgi:hypothetical protein
MEEYYKEYDLYFSIYGRYNYTNVREIINLYASKPCILCTGARLALLGDKGKARGAH